MPAAKPTRSILIKLQDGSLTRVDDIPATAKITVGPLTPGKADFRNNDTALRIYTTVGNQLAVFRNVVSFRDLSLTVKTQKVRREKNETNVQGPNGAVQAMGFIETREWVDDDYEIDSEQEME